MVEEYGKEEGEGKEGMERKDREVVEEEGGKGKERK